MHKRILTIEDLVRFCKEQNFVRFSANESGYQISVQVPAKFSKAEQDDSTMFYGNVLVMHTGLNRNHSSLTEAAAKKAIQNLAYKPVLANFCEIDGVRDFTSHDFDIDENGNYIYFEKQIGCFTADKAYMEKDKEHEDRMNVFAKVAIPREYTDAAEIIERKNGTLVSVELGVNELSYDSKNNILLLEDVEVMGLTCLGVDPNTGDPVKEGMENAHIQIEDFSMESNSVTINAQIINDIADAVMQKIGNSLADSSALYYKEGGNDKLKFQELLKKYGKTVEDIDFEYESMSDEELEEEFVKRFDDPNPEPDPEQTETPSAQDAADAVAALINALPETIDIDDDSDITAAREAYDALSDEAKALISEEVLAILTAAEASIGEIKAAIANQAAADAVTALIDALSEPITLDNAEAVTAAGQAYDGLTPAQRELISAEDTEKLSNARGTIANLLSDDKPTKKRKQNNELVYTVEIDGVVKEYSVSLIDKLTALSTLVNNTYSEADNTYYDVDAYDEEKYVIMHDYWNNKHYRQSYAVKKDVYSLKGDRVEVFAKYLTADEIAKLDNMKADYAVVIEKLGKYEAEPEKMEILNSDDYSQIAETAEFTELRKVEKHFDMTVDEVRDACDKMLLDFAKGNKLSFKETDNKKTVGAKQFGSPKNKKPGRYGNLFKK